MSGITADPGWLPGYAATVDQAADDLAAVLAMVCGSSVTESFGDLGRAADLPAAYAGAAATLRQRLSDLMAALHAVAAGIGPAAGPGHRD